MASERTWVLVADGSRARILQKDEDNRRQLRTIEGMTFSHELPKTSEVVRDRLPRTSNPSATPGTPSPPRSILIGRRNASSRANSPTRSMLSW